MVLWMIVVAIAVDSMVTFLGIVAYVLFARRARRKEDEKFYYRPFSAELIRASISDSVKPLDI